MRMAIKVTGTIVVALGIIVEILGLFYANDAISHNLYGWAGGIAIILGAVAIQKGYAPKTSYAKTTIRN